MQLKGQDSSSHAILRLSHDCQTSSHRFALSTTPDLRVILCREANAVVEIVPTDMRLTCGVIFEARWTAKVYCATNDEIPSIAAHLSNEIFRRHCFASAFVCVCISGQPVDRSARSKSVCWKLPRRPVADLFIPMACVRCGLFGLPFFFSHLMASIISQWQIWPCCLLPCILFSICWHVIMQLVLFILFSCFGVELAFKTELRRRCRFGCSISVVATTFIGSEREWRNQRIVQRRIARLHGLRELCDC